MKKPNNKLLLVLATFSLLIIFGIVGIGTLKGKYTFFLEKNKGSLVLGVADKLPIKDLSNITSSARGEITKKVIEAENQLRSTIERELQNLTKSQIQSIQTKICQDWGIVGSSSTIKE